VLFDPKWEVKVDPNDPKWGVKPKTFSQVLLAAADYMERHGHCANTFEDTEGRVCIFGAIANVGGDAQIAWQKLSEAGIKSVVEFNETHTKAEIVAKLREIARR
jgi:predicted molibdopterin-dependent oxidoreductase YjgC